MEEGLSHWFTQRRLAWEKRSQLWLNMSNALLACCLVVQLSAPLRLFLWPAGQQGSSAGAFFTFAADSSILGVALFFTAIVLSLTCIDFCLPGTELLGGLGNTEFHLELRRHCLAISYRLALRYILPVLLVGTLSSALVQWRLGVLDLLDQGMWILNLAAIAWLAAVLAMHCSLRLPGRLAMLRLLIIAFGVLLALCLASAPLFIAYMLTDNFSDLTELQQRLLVMLAPPGMLLLILWGLLRWSAVPSPDLLERLEKMRPAGRG